MSMTRGLDYVNELANGKQIYKEAKNLLAFSDCVYNCGGFALGIPDWYLPYADDGEYESEELDECYYQYCDDFHPGYGKRYAKPALHAVVLWLILWSIRLTMCERFSIRRR